MRNLKADKHQTVILLIVWLVLSILICHLAKSNVNMKRKSNVSEYNMQYSKMRNESLYKKHMLEKLANIQQIEKHYSYKLDSLNQSVLQVVIELRNIKCTKTK